MGRRGRLDRIGKVADLLVISDSLVPTPPRIPRSPYRTLIDATEADVSLVLVGGEPMAGDVEMMELLKTGDIEIVASVAGCFAKAIDVSAAGAPKGTQSLAQIAALIEQGLRALGGDNPPAGGGPSPLTNTWSYLRLNSPIGAGLTDPQFLFGVLVPVFTVVDGRLNIEAMSPPPLFMVDDDWRFATLAAQVDPGSGLVADDSPPYRRYRANFNHVTALGNPLSAEDFELRWYSPRGVAGTGDACR